MSENGPPADLSPSELWSALTVTPRPWKVVDFPRIDPITKEVVGQVAIWALTQEEQIAASASADSVVKKLMKDPQRSNEANLGYENVYNNEVTVQVLARACRDAKDIKRPAFPSPGQMRKAFSVDEVSVLAVLYLQVQAELGPIVANMTGDEEEAWIGRLAEAGEVFPTASLSPRLLERLLISMARRLVASSMATPSAGSPPGDGSSGAPDPAPDAIAVPAEDHVAEGA